MLCCVTWPWLSCHHHMLSMCCMMSESFSSSHPKGGFWWLLFPEPCGFWIESLLKSQGLSQHGVVQRLVVLLVVGTEFPTPIPLGLHGRTVINGGRFVTLPDGDHAHPQKVLLFLLK